MHARDGRPADDPTLGHDASAGRVTAGEVELSFEATEPLEDVIERLREIGHEPETALVDEAFGRSFTVRDPEGLLLQVNEHDRELQR